LKEYDYAQEGGYLVTVCTDQRKNPFGRIENGRMILSPIGESVKNFWLEIPKHFKNTKLDKFVIMPNHLHGIVIITEKCRGVQLNALTKSRYSQISPKKNTLSVILRTFKATVTTWCRKNSFANFKWHRNYFEHIIRNEKELNNIRQYVIYNPLKWAWDRENLLSKNFDLDLEKYFENIFD
jgi:putative transposase